MISKLPRWAWGGGWALAFVAGLVNAVGLLGFEQQAITHLTGTASRLAAAAAESNFGAVLHFAAILGSFFAGAMLSGALIKNSELQLGHRYGIALLLEALLLGSAVPLLEENLSLGIYAASCACGLQNAMVSTFSGTLVRTTHLTGLFTDLGILFGHALRGLRIDGRRLRLYMLLISGFLVGGAAGALSYDHFGYHALLIPSALTALAGFSYEVFSFRH